MTTQTLFADGTLTVKRIYDAPRERVFDAWIEVSKVQQWFGCDDTTNVRSTVEARVGGAYTHTMTIKGEHEHEQAGVITAYEPPALLEFENRGLPDAVMTVRVEFKDLGGKTEVTLTHSGIPDGLGDIVEGGNRAAFRKLGEFLQREAAEA